MFLGGETADQYEKRDRGLREVTWFRKTTDQWKKSIVDSRERKPAEKTRAQSPKSNFWNGGNPWSENNTKLINTFYCYTFVYNKEEGFS